MRNDDTFLHNVHALSQVNPEFNFAQPTKDPGKPVEPLKAAETFRVKCDVHPWMSAYIVALEHPFFGVSGEDGSFSISNWPETLRDRIPRSMRSLDFCCWSYGLSRTPTASYR